MDQQPNAILGLPVLYNPWLHIHVHVRVLATNSRSYSHIFLFFVHMAKNHILVSRIRSLLYLFELRASPLHPVQCKTH